MARRIAQARTAAGLSQGALARAIGSEAKEVSDYERAEYVPRPERLDTMAKAIGITPEMLLSGVNPLIPPKLSPQAIKVARRLDQALQYRPETAKKAIKMLLLLLDE